MFNGTSEAPKECSKSPQNILKLYKQSRFMSSPKDLETGNAEDILCYSIKN